MTKGPISFAGGPRHVIGRYKREDVQFLHPVNGIVDDLPGVVFVQAYMI